MNGMQGRMLRVPGRKKNGREILLIYGHHAMLERWWGLVQNFTTYGSVTMPDLPGFGGMESFYSIGRRPTIDNYADYLAAFIKLRYKRRHITIIGISFGFVVATRMLQRYPELAKRVDLFVSIVGFMHKDDFTFKPRRRKLYSFVSRQLSRRIPAFIIRYGWLNGFVIRTIYTRLPAGKRRFLEMEPAEFDEMMQFEVKLWQCNDVRTHWATTAEFLKIDNCQQQVDLPVLHVASKVDYYFDAYRVEQHMRIVFSDYTQAIMNSHAHTPRVTGTKKEMAVMVPMPLRKALGKKPS